MENVLVFNGLIVHNLSAKFDTHLLMSCDGYEKFSFYNRIITDIMQNVIL